MAKKATPKVKAKVKVKAKAKAKPAVKAKPKSKAKPAAKAKAKPAVKAKAKPAVKAKAEAKATDKQLAKVKASPAPKTEPKQRSKAARVETQKSEMQVALSEYPDLGATTIDGQRALSFPMKVLEKHFVVVQTEQDHNRAEYAATMARMEANGNWEDLGYPNASDYFEKKWSLTYSNVKTHINALRILAYLGVAGKDLKHAFVKYSHSRLAAVYGYAIKVDPTNKELMEDLVRCERDSQLGANEFRNYLKEKYGARLAAAKDAELAELPEGERPIQFKSFSVVKSLADTILEAHNVAITTTSNGNLPFGEAIAMACAEFVGQHGVGFVELRKTLNAIALRYSVMPILIKNPEATPEQERELKDVPSLQAFEYDGNYVMHTTRAKAAKALGVKADDVKQIRIDITPALKEVFGWSEDRAVVPLPKNVADMKDDEVLGHVNQLKKDMNISRGMMTRLGSGRSSRDLLNFLLGKKASGGFTEAERADLLADEEEPEVDDELTETEIDEAEGAEIDMAEIETKSSPVIDTTAVVKPHGKAVKPKTKPKGKAVVAKKKATVAAAPKKKAAVKVKIKPKPKARATASA